MSGDVRFRPDLGLRMAIYENLVRYLGNLRNHGIRTNEELIELSVVSKGIADSWVKDIAEFDQVEGGLKDTVSDLTDYSSTLEDEILKLKERLVTNANFTDAGPVEGTPEDVVPQSEAPVELEVIDAPEPEEAGEVDEKEST